MEKVVFKKYKNRKIYNVTESRYSTLSDVYRQSIKNLVTVTDVVTGADITNETIVLGALRELTAFGINILAGRARYLGTDEALNSSGGEALLLPSNEEVEKVVKQAMDFAEEIAVNPGILFDPPTKEESEQATQDERVAIGKRAAQAMNSEDGDLFAGKD